MEGSVFNIKRDGLVWLTTRPVWNRDGEKAGYMRFTAVISTSILQLLALKHLLTHMCVFGSKGEKTTPEELGRAVVQSHRRISDCSTVSVLSRFFIGQLYKYYHLIKLDLTRIVGKLCQYITL